MSNYNTTNNTANTNHNISMEDIMSNDINLKARIARGEFDPTAWVVSTMNTATAEAWGWFENPDTGRLELDPDTKRFWSWAEAAEAFAPAADAACWSESMTQDEVDDVANILARKVCSWLGWSNSTEEWLQVKPALANADEDSPAWQALMEESIAEVIEGRA